MSVDDVVNLIRHIDGFNQRMLDDYSQRLVDSNINGAVLASCDLAELKPVLQMAFGDWVLFRSLVESLRYSEQNPSESSDGEIYPPMEAFVRSAACNTAKITAKSTSGAVTVGVADSVTSSSKKATSEMALTSASNVDMSAGLSRSSPTLKDVPTAGDHDVTDDVKPSVSSSPKSHPLLQRQDSFINEVLMESETLRGLVQASVVGSDSEGGTPDSDDDVPRPITTIPEETPVVSRNTSASSLGRVSQRQMSVVRRTSVESGPIDRAFSVGPDHDSGDSDSEVEMLSRKSSIRQTTTGPKQETDGSSAAEDRRKKSTSKSVKHTHDSRRTPPKLDDRSKSVSKLEKGGSESSVPLMSLYFPIACDRSHAGSQSSTYVSPKASGSAVSQPAVSASSTTKRGDSSPPVNDSETSHSCQVAVTCLSSLQHETVSSSGSQPPPSSSAAEPSSTSKTRVTPVQQMSQSAESADTVLSDSVKFFIVDESDTSPKAIMVEMDPMPPRRVSSTVIGDKSSRYDPDHVVL